MGLFDHWKSVRSTYEQQLDSIEHYGVITRIGRRVGPMISLGLRIHVAGRPPTEVSTITWVPRGTDPRLGQHVAFHRSSGGENDHDHFAVDWDKPPRYDRPAERDPWRRLLSLPVDATPQERMRVAQDLFDRGLLSRADYDRARATWGGR
jgi:hypothetical protein